ncbi:unnamed protein product [marine sediment metagenome]|uniref:Uncharacterized protein n=1 Tax=marine sediment metagenome TaxID=412755 RepID=X1GBP4_9ZZZZ
MLVRNLNVSGLSAFAFDDADDLELVAPDPYRLAYRTLGG